MDVILASPSSSLTGPADLAAEAHHRIANSLALLVGTVRMQALSVKKKTAPLSNAEVRLLLEGIAARINTISQLHRLLSYAPADGIISLKPHLHDVTDALMQAFDSDQLVRVVHTGGDCLMMTRQLQPIMLMLCEIFINAMKYAHPSGVSLILVVDCTTTQDGRLVLTITDDGVGLPENFDLQAGGGTGFRIIRGLAAEIGASLDIRSTHLGLSFRLSLPAGAMAGAKLA